MLVRSRRALVKGLAAVATAAAGLRFARQKLAPRVVPVTIRGAAHQHGHRLRGLGGFPLPSREEAREVVIVGGGAAGLSAAWWLERQGQMDHLVLELDDEPGGNARGGRNAVSAYPWGAHYVPVPGEEARYVRLLFEEMGVITGHDAAGRPIYDDYALCAAPRDRLLIHGRWQEGLVPEFGVPARDKEQYRAFFAKMAAFAQRVGSDGRRAFAIPVDLSSRDPELLALDQTTMTAWMEAQGFDSAYLRWYVDYCCRDDFGLNAAETSAWAGIHYFASRHGEAGNAAADEVLTWPEGNGRIISHLAAKAKGRIATGRLVHSVEPDQAGGGWIVDALDTGSDEVVRYRAKAVIVAAPQFIAKRLVKPWRDGAGQHGEGFSYAPWLVCNLTLSELPDDGRGVGVAWDNVSYRSRSLGYIVATHQNLEAYPRQSVVTFYWPLTDEAPEVARARAAKETPEGWRELVLGELRGFHPEIEPLVEAVDVWIWGHGMVRPVPGFMWGEARQRALAAREPGLHLAHSDLSGLSIFEEAQYRGVEAARAVLRELGRADGAS